jgi:hypothetical protein
MSAFILDHRTGVYALWSFFINMLSIATGFLYAHFAAYRHEDSFFSEKLMIGVEMIYFTDMCIHFVLAYPDPRGPFFPPIKSAEKCRKNYLSGQFIWHLLPMIPL